MDATWAPPPSFFGGEGEGAGGTLRFSSSAPAAFCAAVKGKKHPERICIAFMGVFFGGGGNHTPPWIRNVCNKTKNIDLFNSSVW